ncbi:MAG: winged helix-turn-helix domain-containing protein [Parcubacteria group bacterium]
MYRFGPYVLDPDQCELRRDGVRRPVEPQVLALLRLLVENRGRVVSKDELVEAIWAGRIVSDAAIASRVKAARQAIGDDGASQGAIRTVHKLGFRFVAPVELMAREDAGALPAIGRPSIAVLPFTPIGAAAAESVLGDALPHDLIVELSRLRWLFVIARGSSFQFRGPAELDRVAASLRARYCLSGSVEMDGRIIAVSVELAETRTRGVVWSERYRFPADGVHEIRHEIVRALVAALDLQIAAHEAQCARLTAPENLDAWAAYHLGLQHMYRFSREGNALAALLFERAAALEPGFARAHAGLSFTRFEDAFLQFAGDPGDAAMEAQRHADAALEREPLDPFCNLVKGRAFWLHGDLDASLPWLDRAAQLSPNYAQAKYSQGWTKTLIGQPRDARANIDEALSLSPLDPLAYGMMGVRAFSHLAEEDWSAAAAWGERAARAPGAHALIEMIAALSHRLNGDAARADYWQRSAMRRHPGLNAEVFLKAFPFRDERARRLIGEALEATAAYAG